MSNNRNISEYLDKAAKYEMLAQFYKYSNPNLHIHYYLKHLDKLNRAIHMMHHYSKFHEDRSNEAKFRFLHASPDAPKVDVYVNNTLLTKEVSYKNVSEYLWLPLGKHQIDLYPARNTENKLLSKEITVESGKSYTITFIGTRKNLRLVSYLNQPDVPAGEAKIRYLNLSPDSQPLDVAIKDRDVIFSELTFEKASEYLGITAMTIDLEIRAAGTKNIILSLNKSKFSPNQVYTMVIVGFSENRPKIEVFPLKD